MAGTNKGYFHTTRLVISTEFEHAAGHLRLANTQQDIEDTQVQVSTLEIRWDGRILKAMPHEIARNT